MSEMVERVARAITDVLLKQGVSDVVVEPLARAAIEAMREPTDKMIIACQEVNPSLVVSNSAIWAAMIDAALKE